MSEYAKIKVERFRKQFQSQYGDGHYFFACHAAFPIAFSVDLLYQLWANFKDIPAIAVEKADSPFPIWSRTIDRLAVSDLLQSDLCRRTDHDLFEMETEVRTYLLQQLEDYFTGERLNSLARFSYQYVDQRINDPYYRAFRDTQRWVSMARLAPEKAAEQLVAYYNLMLEKDNAAELSRLAAILEALTLMDARFADLSAFSKAIKTNYSDLSEEERQTAIQESMNKVVRIRSGMAERAGGLKVRLTDQLKIQSLTFKKEIAEESDLLALRFDQAEEQGGISLNLSGLDLTYLPKEVFRYPDLETLDLSQNRLSEIPPEIEQFKNLRQLILDDNRIIDLSENIGRLQLLEDLSLKNNEIDFLPPWITDLPNLRRLDLRGNHIENIQRDQLLFESSADFSKLERFFFPEPTGFNQPMILILILIADPWERSAIQRALKPAVEKGLLHIELPESGQPWRLFQLLRQFRDQTCLLHINGSGVEDNFTYQFGSPPKTHSLPLHAWNKIVDTHGNGQLCFISGGTGKRVVDNMLRRTFKACIYSTDFQTTNEEGADSFVSTFYGGMATGRTLGEAFDFANNISEAGLKNKVQQQSTISDARSFSIQVRDSSIMNWRLMERNFPESFASLEALKAYLEEWLSEGWPGSLFTPLQSMLSRDSEKFKQLGSLQDEWEQLQSEGARRGFWESEESPMRMFLRGIEEGDLREGVIETPVSEEGPEEQYEQAEGEEQEQEQLLEEGQLWFLGIGISKYMQMPDIRNAVSDVRAIQQILEEKYGLASERTILLFDGEADKKNIFKVFGGLADRMPAPDQLIIYLCGHSHFDARTQYNRWFPFDATPENIDSQIADIELFDFMSEIDANDILLVSDGVFSTRHLESRGFLKREGNSNRSRWKLSSGYNYGLVQAETPRGNSPFATSIVEELDRNEEDNLLIQDFGIQVIKRYARETDGREKPEFQPLPWAGHEGGEFVFKLRNTSVDENIYDTETTETTENQLSGRQTLTLEGLKSELKERLRDRDFEEVFDLVHEYLKPDSTAYNDWIFQQGRYNDIIRQQKKGIIDPDFVQRTFNQIADVLIYQIDNLQESDVHIPDRSESGETTYTEIDSGPFWEKISQLDLESLQQQAVKWKERVTSFEEQESQVTDPKEKLLMNKGLVEALQKYNAIIKMIKEKE